MIFNWLFFCYCLVSLCFAPSTLEARDKIVFVSTIPDLSWLAKEIGGDLVDAKALLSGKQNPHFMDAVPSFVRLTSQAQVFCFVGLELEVGYLPPILSRAGNQNIQKGGKGFCDASEYVEAIDKETHPVDRSMGDVHPAGNPHYYLSPTEMIKAAKKIKEVLTNTNPEKSTFFIVNFEKTRQRILELRNSLYTKFEDIHKFQKNNPLKFSAIEYHREFGYFFKEYDIRSMGSLEAIPGVSPSISRINELAKEASRLGVWIGLNADYNRTKTTEKFTELSKISFINVPTMTQPDHGIKSYYELQEKIAEEVLNTFHKRGDNGKVP
jgi:zinc/manganese transport system substrate-binding protein